MFRGLYTIHNPNEEKIAIEAMLRGKVGVWVMVIGGLQSLSKQQRARGWGCVKKKKKKKKKKGKKIENEERPKKGGSKENIATSYSK